MKGFSTYDKVEKYLHHKMSDEEVNAFENQIAEDHELADYVRDSRMADEAILFASLAELKQTIGKDIKNIKHDSGSGNALKFLAIIAAIGGILGYLLYINSREIPQKKTVAPSVEEAHESPINDAAEKNEKTSSNVNAPKPGEGKITYKEPMHQVVSEEIPKPEIKEEDKPVHQDEMINIPKSTAPSSSQPDPAKQNSNQLETIAPEIKSSASPKPLHSASLNKAYSFNPDNFEKWELQYIAGEDGSFTIFDKTGKTIYTNNFGQGGESWNGMDMQGNIVPMGIYMGIIKYSDGRMEKVELTIVR